MLYLSRFIACVLLPCMTLCPQVSKAQSKVQTDLLATEFDARLWADGEKRLLQIALGHSGDYLGLFDGKWGRGSQQALERFSMREFDTFIVPNIVVAAAIAKAMDAERAEGWRELSPGGHNIELRLPTALVSPIRSKGWEYAWQSDDEELFVGLGVSRIGSPAEVHEEIGGQFGYDPSDYDVRRPERLVTARKRGGGSIYLRSDRTANGWHTLFVSSKAVRSALAVQLIASSYYFGERRFWIDAPTPRVGALIEALAATVESGTATADEDRQQKKGRAGVANKGLTPDRSVDTRSGTGFYIGPNILITNNYVVENCTRLEQDDKSELELIARDARTDLAALKATRRASDWLDIAEADPLLGANVFVLGYPLFQTFSVSLSVTRGVLSSATGLHGDPTRFTLSAAVQPGNSGGPVLDRSGLVVGVVVARISDTAVAEATGALPQTLNYAIKRRELIDFISRKGVKVTASNATAKAPLNGKPVMQTGREAKRLLDLDEGVPVEIQRPVVPIICHAPG